MQPPLFSSKRPKLHHNNPHAPRRPSGLSQVTNYPYSSPQRPPPPPSSSPTLIMSDTETDLFPTGAGAGPHTPPHNNLNAAAPGELSPPRSQGGVGGAAGAVNGGPGSATNMLMNTTNGTTSSSSAFNAPGQGDLYGAGEMSGVVSHNNNSNNAGGMVGGAGAGTGGLQQQEGAAGGVAPGEWKTKKAQDEMSRAWECVGDKDWSMREFGDVVLARGQQVVQGGS